MQSSTGFRLSPQQKRIWLLQGDGPAFLGRCAVLLEGELDLPRLRDAVGRVVGRHEVLRTSFRRKSGLRVPFQVIGERGAVDWTLVDAARTGGDPRSWAEELLRAEPPRPDPERGPVPALSLVRGPAREHLLLIALPSLCADSATLVNLLDELIRCYGADGAREDDAEPVQYADYSEWQNELLETDDEAAAPARAYWRGRDPASTRSPALPFELPGGEDPPFRRGLVATDFGPGLTGECLAAARGCEGLAAHFWLACWLILLARRCGGQAAAAVRFDGRVFPDLRRALGLFARWLPLGCRLAPGLSFREVLERLARDAAQAEEYQLFFPPEADGTGSRPSELPAVGFELDTAPAPRTAARLTFTLRHREALAERFTLLLSCTLRDAALEARWTYDTSRYEEGDVERLAREFRVLCRAAAARPDAAVDQLDLLDASERRRLLDDFDDTRLAPEGTSCVHELFEAAAESCPERIALVDEECRITYGELDRRGSRLARSLRRLGVGPDVPVAVCLERSFRVVLAQLAVLKAGGAYAVLETAQPRRRLAMMLEDVGAPVVLTRPDQAESLPPGPAARISVDAGEQGTEPSAGEAPAVAPTPRNLAYVVFTSGSTGRPKGVAVAHEQLVNYLRGALDRLRLATVRSFATVSTFAADLGNTSVFPALCGGATLHVVSARRASDAEAFGEYFERHRVEGLKIVPSHLRALLESARPRRVLPRKRLVLGGEVFDLALARTLGDLAGSPGEEQGRDRRIFNHYGPSETTVGVLTHEVEPARRDPRRRSLPLGKPIPNTRVYLADRHLRVVPAWVPGELLVGGAGVARGYLGQARPSAVSFFPDPFGTAPGARLYRTGDLARHLSDGTVEFLGRLDQQVKFHGFRVEPEEIRAALNRHPAVRDSVIRMMREEASGDVLAAYYVAGRELAGTELREWLAQSLPAEILPSLFVYLKNLPLSANGKVRLEALPSLEQVREQLAGKFVPPENPVEQQIAAIWAEVLGLGEVGRRHDFFELGGHSLLATQVLSRLHRSFDVELPVRTLFEQTTVAGLARAVEEARSGASGPKAPPILPVPRDRDLPLSFAQQRLWFLHRMEPRNPAYNQPRALRLTGRLAAAALERTLGELTGRHESLRAFFPLAGGEPVQRVAPRGPLSLPMVDLGGLAADTARAEARRLRTEEALRPFDLTRPPMMRVALLRLDESEHILLLSLHHIASDAVSTDILGRELGTLYNTFTAAGGGSAPSPLPELAIQYADFAVWQRRRLSGRELADRLAYWREHLAPPVPVCELPADRPRRAVPDTRGARTALTLDAEVARQLRELGGREGATLFMVLLAAFKALLYRLTGQSDLVVGTPIAGRNRAEIEGVVGFFVNTLALRTRLSPARRALTFQDLLARVRETALGAFTHQELPFEKLVEELRPARDTSRNPFFDVMFSLQNAPLPAPRLRGLELSPLRGEHRPAIFDLNLDVAEIPQGLLASFDYRPELFDATTLRRLAARFRRLAGNAAAHPGRELVTLATLEPSERHQLVSEWNDTLAAEAGETFDQLFAARAARAPGAPAAVFEGEVLTYRELDRRADRLARHLRALGVGPDVPVGICLERSLEMVTAVLGVLKAGGAYLPLDPEYPRERLAFMLEDSRAPVVLTTGRLAGRLPAAAAFRIVEADRQPTAVARPGEAPPARGPRPDNLAYVIHTSGSTGRPKGALISHRCLVTYIRAAKARFGLEPTDRFLQFASLSFDVSAEELFPTWLAGAAVVLCRRERLLSPAGFCRLLAEEGITGCELPTAFWQEWARELAATGERLPTSLRFVILGGERVAREHLESWQRLRMPLFHVYGLTETTVTSTVHRPPPGREAAAAGQLPVGRPLDGAEVHLLDRHSQPVGIGVAGELWVGGTSLGRGYLRRAALTAERFVPHVSSPRPGERLYKTGDLARFLGDAAVEFLGRVDHQVKVRGYRVELEEIESVLTEVPAVREAVAVVARTEGDPAGRRLVAYVVPESARPVTSRELRRALSRRLPEFMVPSLFVVLGQMPLNPSGKFDRAALGRRPLPAPTAGRGPDEAPRAPLEEILAGIWAEVLSVPEVGVHDDFFELGGHSLLAVRLVARIQEVLATDLPLQRLFEAPTVAGLAAGIESSMQGHEAPQAPPLVVVPREGKLVPSYAQERMWITSQLQPDDPGYHVMAGIPVEGRFDLPAWQLALDEFVRRHEILRTHFRMLDGELVQVIRPPRQVPLLYVDLRRLPKAPRRAEAARLVVEEKCRRFDLGRGPLVRAGLLRLARGSWGAFLTLHHIVTDGWSTTLLVEELSTLYRAFSRRQPSPLPELAFQYADFAAWERRWLRQERLETLFSYWRRRLAGVRTVLALPSDRPRPRVPSTRGGVLTGRLSPELTGVLRKLSRREGSSLFMVLLALFQTLLYRLTGETDLALTTDVANRTVPGTEGLIGFFVNVLVLRGDLSGNPTFRQLVGRVREMALGAYAHQDMPFGELVKRLHLDRGLDAQPPFNVNFGYVTDERALPVAPRRSEPISREGPPVDHPAWWDLSFFIGEQSERLVFSLHYKRDLFEAATIARMVRNFEALAENAAAEPDTPLEDLELLSDAARQERALAKQRRQKEALSRFKKVRPKAVSLPGTDPAEDS